MLEFLKNLFQKTQSAVLSTNWSTQQKKRGVLALLLILLLTAVHFTLLSTLNTLADKQARLFGFSMNKRLTEQSTPYLLEQNLIGLSVIVQRYTHDPLISYAAIYDGSHRILTEAGQEQFNSPYLYSSPIQYQDQQIIGHALILLDSSKMQKMISSTLYYFWRWVFLISGLSLLVFIAFKHHYEIQAFLYQQREQLIAKSQRYKQQPTQKTTDTNTQNQEHYFELSFSAANYNTLKSALTPSYLENCFAHYLQLCQQACELYHGKNSCTQKPNITVQFFINDINNQQAIEKAYFDAICTAELFLGLVEQHNNKARKNSRPAMAFQALLVSRKAHLNSVQWNYVLNEEEENEEATTAGKKKLDLNHLKSTGLFLANSDLAQLTVASRLLLESDNQDSPLVCVNTLSAQYRQLINRQIQHLLSQEA